MGTHRSLLSCFTLSGCAVVAAFTLSISSVVQAQSYSNPYATVTPWATLSGGRTMGAVGDTDVDPDGGTHLGGNPL